MRFICSVLLIWAFAGSTALSDTVVLKGGRKLTDVVVSRNDDQIVVVNPWNSRHPKMVWEIPDRNRLLRAKVEEVVIADPPAVEARRRAARMGLTADGHVELAAFCAEHDLKEAAEHHLATALMLEPQHATALERFGQTEWEVFKRKHPEFAAEVHRAERAYVKAVTPEELEAALTGLKAAGSKRPLAYLERARRSAKIKPGRRDQVPLTVASDQVPGATYAIHVSTRYDPLTPTALVIGLHGGGVGGRDETLVTGSGESALNFYQEEAERLGWIVACPTALKAPWPDRANAPLLDALIDELMALYNIDQHRVYLVGHSMGGIGTWFWGPQKQDLWAACAPCAGLGGPRGLKIPVYIYHGTDDPICTVDSDRSSAKALRGDLGKEMPREQFVYTEIDGVGHGFPDWVRRDIFDWFAGIRRERERKLLDSSFEAKPTRAEIKAFGDPSRPGAADDDGEQSVKELIAAIKGGGGGGAEAALRIGLIKTREAVAGLANVLAWSKASVDSQVLAATALGDIALPECVKPLGKAVAARDSDFRVVDAATAALGRIATPDTVDPLLRAGHRMGEFFEKSFFGDSITHTEYEVRLASFEILTEALARAGAPEKALPLFQREIVERVFDPPEMYKVYGDEDERFRNASPRARQKLTRKLADALMAYRDPAGIPLLERIRDRWSGDARIVLEAGRGIEELMRVR